MTTDLQDLAIRLGAKNAAPTGQFLGFSWDSRDVRPGSVFLAIKGSRADGHDHVVEALRAGAVAAVVERPMAGPCLVVDNLVEALARFALSLREEFPGPVVGVTGSNGKTTTKELVAAALGSLGPVLKSPGNHNTEYSAPLVWASLDRHKAVVAEMAMRGFGQIAHLATFTKPTIGIVTMIGTAHIEMVGSRAGIVQAKSELLAALPPDGTAIAWREDEYFDDLARASAAPVRSFGFSQEAECRITGYRPEGLTGGTARIELGGVKVDVSLPAPGRHMALNTAAALLAADSAGVDPRDAVEGIARAELPPLRMQVVALPLGTALLDTYNASPDSTVAAIKTFDELPIGGRRLAVLGEMLELGDFSESGHRMVGRALAESRIDRTLLVGAPMAHALDEARRSGFPADRIVHIESLNLDQIHRFIASTEAGDTVLVKGSRALGLERALEGLSSPAATS
ncbi:MAG: UDP-N-acetylmuramoyl-tripeptide--D-alanyl-D-alanine ligase [Fimbriimonadaceae bacterium]|nr:UDP-N-acetylmuramoyl-tripeptide--D-alanyl-D-alanine ligase [Fimbriimonadaceae bacterium]QYK59510.1 MAG: UDP-N-acetylmuramoyl-tripeptide--D-alanyl-D-alanine ligase [Fimbriimonadaceae bacterium]